MRNKKFLISLVTLFIMLGCANPLDDFNIHVAPTFYKYVVEVELTDLSDPQSVFDGEVDIEITGEDAGSIFNIDGKKQFKPNFGSLQLITTRANEPTAGDPLRFRVEINSNTYRSESIDIVVREDDYYVSRNISLLDLSNLPDGINSATASGSLMSNGELNQNLVFNTDTNNSNPSQMKLTVPTGVKFMNSSGSVLSGTDLEVVVLNFNDTNSSSQLSLPNNSGAVQNLVIDGVVEKVLLDPGATFDVDMEIGGERVTKFSDSIQFDIPLPDHMYNFEEGRPYQAGDKVSLISNSHGDTTWAHEGNYTIQSKNGKLVIKPSVNHLCWFRVSRPWYSWNLPPMNYVTFKNDKSQPINTTVLARFENSSTNYRYNIRYAIRLNPGQSVSFSFRQSNVFDDVRLIPLGSKLPEYEVSASGRNISVNFIEPQTSVEVGYKLYCKSSQAFVVPPAGVKMYYRKTSVGGKYNHLYTFSGENNSDALHKVSELEAGVLYDFRAHYGEHEVDTNAVEVINRKIYQVNLPGSVCEAIGF